MVKKLNAIICVGILLMSVAGCRETAAVSSEAKSIWVKGAEREMNAYYGFSARFDVESGAKPVLRFSAGGIARVWVNGKFAAYGPARAPEGYMRMDEWPLAHLVSPGRNTVAIEVSNPAVNQFYLPDRPAYLYAEIVSDGRVLAATGRDFAAKKLSRVQKINRFSYQRGFAEFYRLNPEDDAWRVDGISSPGLPVAECPPLKPLGRCAPYPTCAFDGTFKNTVLTLLVPRDAKSKMRPSRTVDQSGIAPYKGFRKAELEVNLHDKCQELVLSSVRPANPNGGPVVLKAREGAVFEGIMNTAGFPYMEVSCSKPATLYMTMDEFAGKDGLPNPFRFGGCANVCGWRLEKPGRYVLECFQAYGLKCAHVFLEEGEIEIAKFDVRTYLNPDPERARFRSSDPAFEKVFRAAAQSLACNAVDVFTDCPGRERGAYFGDTVFTGRGADVLLADHEVERTLYENYALAPGFSDIPEGMIPMCYPADVMLSAPYWIANFALWSVVQLQEFVGRSGDRSVADLYRKRAEGILGWFRKSVNADGLLENLPGWVFVEWSEAARFTKGISFPSTMIYIRFLDAFADVYGDADCAKEAQRLRAKIREMSWNGEWFRDNAVRNAAGVLEYPGECTEVCQYFAFLSKTATPQSHPELWRRLVEELGPKRKKGAHPRLWPSNMLFGYSTRFGLLSEAGLSARVLDEVKSCFLPMAEKTGTLWESVGTDGFSCCHGFPCQAAWLLVRDALGVKQIDRRTKTVHVSAPKSVPLEWCEATLPVSREESVTVKWRRGPGGLPVYESVLPQGWKLVGHDGL